MAPMREKRESITDADVLEVLKNAGEKARAKTEEKMKTVRKAIGVA